MQSGQKKILIIEDEEDYRTYISSILGGAGYHCILASNGTEGHTLYEERLPDLVLLDINMPGISGIVALRKIHQTAQAHNRPARVVMLTARSEKALVQESLANGASGYLLKTASPNKLLETVREQLGA
jgi:CheY-like chemotaxis protein